MDKDRKLVCVFSCLEKSLY